MTPWIQTINQPITDPERAKEHIANYFEELYQAREREEAYKQWTHTYRNKGEGNHTSKGTGEKLNNNNE